MPNIPASWKRRHGQVGVGGPLVGGFLSVAASAAVVSPARLAHACGDAEGAGSCGGAAVDEARWMLKRVVAAVRADEPKALGDFTRGAGGFRTLDTYVFCIGAADGRMSAHPDPKLMGQDARALRDPKGKAFGAEMLDVAKEDQISEVHYLYPRPGSPVSVPKTSFVTRVKDQVCGVGYYDADARAAPEAVVPPSAANQVVQARRRLDAGMPAGLRAEWTAFLAALDRQRDEEEAALAKVRESVRAAEAALAIGARPASAR